MSAFTRPSTHLENTSPRPEVPHAFPHALLRLFISQPVPFSSSALIKQTITACLESKEYIDPITLFGIVQIEASVVEFCHKVSISSLPGLSAALVPQLWRLLRKIEQEFWECLSFDINVIIELSDPLNSGEKETPSQENMPKELRHELAKEMTQALFAAYSDTSNVYDHAVDSPLDNIEKSFFGPRAKCGTKHNSPSRLPVQRQHSPLPKAVLEDYSFQEMQDIVQTRLLSLFSSGSEPALKHYETALSNRVATALSLPHGGQSFTQPTTGSATH